MTQLIVIVGPNGVGKSTTAMQVTNMTVLEVAENVWKIANSNGGIYDGI